MKISVFDSALRLPAISTTAANAYRDHIEKMERMVDAALSKKADIWELIGYNSLSLMYDNHRYHVRCMSTIFCFNAYNLLTPAIVWLYRAYHSSGFSYKYFPVDFRSWQKALSDILPTEAAAEINQIYQWMIDHHEEFLLLADSPDYQTLPDTNDLQERGEMLLDLMLNSDYKSCLEFITAFIHSPRELGDFYVDILTPCLHKIGRLWEEGEISAAQECLVTAIATQVMSAMYSKFVLSAATKGRVLIMLAPREQHAVGARMFSDLLEMDGWQVKNPGPQSTISDILEILREFKPHVLGISVVIPFHIDSVCQMISQIKKDRTLQNIKILVGGLAFAASPDLWRATGADAYCADSRETVKELADWWESQGGKMHEA